MSKEADIHILGGGPAGMASAYYAKKNNVTFKIFESTGSIGVNCRTLELNSFKFDTGAHRFHDKIPSVTLEIKKILGDELRKVVAPSKIYFNNSYINFPIQISEVLNVLDIKTILKIIKEVACNQIYSTKTSINFKDYSYRRYGKTLSELFLMNYSEKLWGLPPKMLQTEISGGRLKGLNITNIIKEMIFKNRKSDHLDGSFYYPRNGYGSIFENIRNIIGDKHIEYHAPITKLIHKNSKIEKIIYNNSKIVPVEKVISTLPITSLIKILDPSPPEAIMKNILKFRYRSLKLCVILINKERISNNASIYFPEKNIPYTRMYEPKNRSEYLAPENQTAIVVEVPYEIDIVDKSDFHEVLLDLVQTDLINKNFFSKDDIILSKIINIPNAYPVLKIGFDEEMGIVKEYLMNFKNLYMVGRNAEFKYLHTHDLFYKSQNLINQIFI